MYGCESWSIKKAERWKIDAFELWCWRGLLRVPWTARRSNQPILKEISPECSLEGLMLKLKLQYFDHLMQRTDSLEKTPDAGEDWRQEKGMIEDKMVGWHHRLHGHEFEQASGVDDGQGSLACSMDPNRDPWGRKKSDTNETDKFGIAVSSLLPCISNQMFIKMCWLQKYMMFFLKLTI